MAVIDLTEAEKIVGKDILFDTNIWLLIDGPSYGAMDFRATQYSGAYKKLRVKNNIIVNEYVIAEFSNRYFKLEYEAQKRAADDPDSFCKLKQYRKGVEGARVLESIRDTCMSLLDECSFAQLDHGEPAVRGALEDFSRGELDLTDIFLREHCSKKDLFFLTDDIDFSNCSLNIITANPKLLRAAKGT